MSRYEGLREKAEHAYMASMLTPRIAERKCFKPTVMTQFLPRLNHPRFLRVSNAAGEEICSTKPHEIILQRFILPNFFARLANPPSLQNNALVPGSNSNPFAVEVFKQRNSVLTRNSG